MAEDRTLPADVTALAAQAITALKATSGAATAPARKEIRGVILGMTGLLGKQKDEDAYIRALLMVDGVTSVTVDRVRPQRSGAGYIRAATPLEKSCDTRGRS